MQVYVFKCSCNRSNMELLRTAELDTFKKMSLKLVGWQKKQSHVLVGLLPIVHLEPPDSTKPVDLVVYAYDKKEDDLLSKLEGHKADAYVVIPRSSAQSYHDINVLCHILLTGKDCLALRSYKSPQVVPTIVQP